MPSDPSATLGSIRTFLADRQDHEVASSVTCTRDGDLAAAICIDGSLRVLAKGGAEVSRVRAANAYARAGAIAGRGARAVGGAKTLAVLDVATGKKTASLAHAAQVCALACDDAGDRVVAADDAGELAVWDLVRGERIATRTEPLAKKPFAIEHLVISRDGARIATANVGIRVPLAIHDAHDLAAPRATRPVEPGASILPIAFDPTGDTLLVRAPSALLRLAVADLSEIERHPLSGVDGATLREPVLAWGATAGTLAYCERGDRMVVVMDLATRAEIALAELPAAVRSLATSDGGRIVWIVTEARTYAWDLDGTERV